MEEIAIIGMSGRFPGANTLEEFRENLWSGKESITFYSEKQLLEQGISIHKIDSSLYVPAASIFSKAEYFDASFFNFSTREARLLDPQQRCFLECAWHALEHAGYSQETYDFAIGVFAGASENTYLLENIQQGRINPNLDFMDFVETRQGNDKDFLATRVSYKLNLTGPSYTIQSACSTSLLTVHIACQNLLNGECDIALAGGVTVLYPHAVGYQHKPGSIVSPDGHCRTFSAKAQGTIFGSGVGIVVLKRLQEALQDGDNILAIIKGSAVNNDGAVKPSFTAPSLDKQSEVINDALVMADVKADSIGYVEAHGTGTPIGDPIEVAALTQAYRKFTSKKQYCAIGSVKTNIGHLDVAAGMAGLIKTILILKHKGIPPTLHFEDPNPNIDFKNSPFYVNTSLQEFECHDAPRRAGISSLGVGGTNVHMILEEAPEEVTSVAIKPQIILISAKTISALKTVKSNLHDYLEEHPNTHFGNLAFTLQVGRRHFPFAHAFICNNIQELLQQLEDPELPIYNYDSAINAPSIGFIITDYSHQALNVIWALYQVDINFQQDIDQCIQMWNIIPNLSADERITIESIDTYLKSDISDLKNNVITSIIQFCIQYALIKQLLTYQIPLKKILTFGISELSVACISGLLSLSDAITILLFRCKSKKIDDSEINKITFLKPDLPLYLFRNNSWKAIDLLTLPDCLLNQDYSSLNTKLPQDEIFYFDLGNNFNKSNGKNRIIASLKTSNKNIHHSILELILEIWIHNREINWRNLHTDKYHRIPLPGYPFERKCYNYKNVRIPLPKNRNTILHRKIYSSINQEWFFESDLDFMNFPFLDFHRVFGVAIVPGSFHISMALSAAQKVLNTIQISISDIVFGKALMIENGLSKIIQLSINVNEASANKNCYFLQSIDSHKLGIQSSWDRHGQGIINAVDKTTHSIDIDFIKLRLNKEMSAQEFYQKGYDLGFHWREGFRSLSNIFQQHIECLALLKYPLELAESIPQYSIHPAILDACLQSYLPILMLLLPHNSDPFIPLSISQFQFFKQPTERMWIYARLQSDGQSIKDSCSFNITAYDEQGEVIFNLENLTVIKMPKQAFTKMEEKDESQLVNIANDYFIYRPKWELQPIKTNPKRREIDSVIIVGHHSDRWNLSEKLAEFYADILVFKVSLGTQSKRHTSHHIEIDCQNIDDYHNLVSQLPETGHLFFLGGLKSIAECGQELNKLEMNTVQGVQSMLFLMQALSIVTPKNNYSFNVITHDLHHIVEQDQTLYPFSGGLIGFSKVLAREFPQHNVNCIDLCSQDLDAASNDDWDNLFEALECEKGTVDVSEVAYRNNLRFVKRNLCDHKICKSLHETKKSNISNPKLREKGVYIILGGAGGIGVSLSHFLAKNYQAKCIWIGRRPLDEIITNSLDNVRKAGGEAIYIQADGNDLNQMQMAYKDVKHKFGQVNGIIHSSLILNDQPIRSMTLDQFQAAYNIKSKSSVILQMISSDDMLDFIAFFSSENAIRGWYGLANYVSGCTFKDLYAQYLFHILNRPVVIFNWGFWGEVGIAATQENIRRLVKKQGIQPITTDEGLAVFSLCLQEKYLQVIPNRINPKINEQLKIDNNHFIDHVSDEVTSKMKNIVSRVEEYLVNNIDQISNEPWMSLLNNLVQIQALIICHKLGASVRSGEVFDIQNLLMQNNIKIKFEPLLKAIQDILLKAGFIQNHSHTFTNYAEEQLLQYAIENKNLYENQRDKIIHQNYQSKPWFNLLDTTLKDFVAVLAGNIKATDILFPNGSVALVESVYRGNPVSDYYNQIVCECIKARLEDLNNVAKFRILEFGAGTGATSKIILDVLKPYSDIVEYTFTDISQHFVHHAKQNMAKDYPFLNFRTFDMTQYPNHQDIATGFYDIVLGTNVIHVCPDIFATVAKLKHLLKENGLLILNELTYINDIWTLTFGLLDGWWLYEDEYLRLPHTPLLDRKNWQLILQANGFNNIQCFSRSPIKDNPDHMMQCVFLAESDGEIICSYDQDSPKTNLSNITKNENDPINTFEMILNAKVTDRNSLLQQYLQSHIAKILEIENPQSIALDEPMGQLGMDSLIVISFCNDLSKIIGETIPTTAVFDHPTIEAMTDYLMDDILGWSINDEATNSNNENINNSYDENTECDIDTLSEGQIERLLEAELED